MQKLIHAEINAYYKNYARSHKNRQILSLMAVSFFESGVWLLVQEFFVK